MKKYCRLIIVILKRMKVRNPDCANRILNFIRAPKHVNPLLEKR